MQTAKIAVATMGQNQIVAGIAGQKFRVLAFVLSFSGTVNAKWCTNPGSASPAGAVEADLSGLFYGAAGLAALNPPIPTAHRQPQVPNHFVTNVGDDLALNLSAGTAVGGYVIYDTVNGSL